MCVCNTTGVHLPGTLLSLPVRLLGDSLELACRSIGPRRGGFFPKGDSCDDGMLRGPGSGSVSLTGGRPGGRIVTGPAKIVVVVSACQMLIQHELYVRDPISLLHTLTGCVALLL